MLSITFAGYTRSVTVAVLVSPPGSVALNWNVSVPVKSAALL